MSFSSFELNHQLLKALEEKGFNQPTPIQKLAIPPLLQGRDVMGTAVTGSGKTAAFLLPILNRLINQPRGKTKALILVPTRELAVQITEHFLDLARHTQLKAAAVYGGVSPVPQEQAFRKGVDVLVATPGRLLDHMRNDYARLKEIDYLVLDEADRMLDMGFLPDIRRILGQLPEQRQSLFFSATLPRSIVRLAEEMLDNPIPLNISPKPMTTAQISHVVYLVSHELKSALLLALLKQSPDKSVLAFTRTKHRANRLAEFLEKQGVSCTRIHGNRTQGQRTEALASFKKGRFRVLVATDIAARGIDIEALDLVCNFDVPPVVEDYVHRVGRTGRASAMGDACTLVSPDEESTFRSIEQGLGRRMARETIPGFDYEKRPSERFEIPLKERIAAIRRRRKGGLSQPTEKSQWRSSKRTESDRMASQDGSPSRVALGPRRSSTIFGLSNGRGTVHRRPSAQTRSR